MAIVKLSNVGESATWRIKSAEAVAGKYGSQVKFESDKGDLLYISEETAGRQLARISLDVAKCAGETLTFSRTENPKGGAPYWNINVADAVDRSAPAQGKRLPAPRFIKGLDDIELPEPGPYAVDAQNYPIRQANMPNLSAPAPTDDDAPEWVTETPQPRVVSDKTKARMQVAREYIDLLGWVKADQPKLSDEAAQAAAATIWISWGQGGLR